MSFKRVSIKHDHQFISLICRYAEEQRRIVIEERLVEEKMKYPELREDIISVNKDLESWKEQANLTFEQLVTHIDLNYEER